jgi:hypothetical protein
MYDTLEGHVEVAKSRWSSSAMSSSLAGITPRSCWAMAKGLDTSIWEMMNKAMMFICSACRKYVYQIYIKLLYCKWRFSATTYSEYDLMYANDEMHSDATVVTSILPPQFTSSQLTMHLVHDSEYNTRST